MKKTIGDFLLDKIIQNGLCKPQDTNDEPIIFIWSSATAEILEAAVAEWYRSKLKPGDSINMQQLGDAICQAIPDGHGFALFVPAINSAGATMRYISNCKRDTIVPMLEEWIRKTKDGYGTHQK